MARSSREHELDQAYEELLERLDDARFEGNIDLVRRLERELERTKRRAKRLHRLDDGR